jgi:hypothetical protein
LGAELADEVLAHMHTVTSRLSSAAGLSPRASGEP